MADVKKLAIQGAVATTVGLEAGNFADALLKQEKLLMPSKQGNANPAELAEALSENSPYLKRIATSWKSDHSVIDRFANTLNKNPEYLKKFQDISARDAADGKMNVATGLFEKFAHDPNGLAGAINAQHRKDFPAQYASAPAAAKPSTPSPAKHGPIEVAAEPRAQKPADTKPTPSSVPAAASDAISPGGAQGIVQTAVMQYREIFGAEFYNEEQALLGRLEKDPSLRNRLADILNKDPELKAQLEGKEGSDMVEKFKKQSPEVQKSIKDAIRNSYRDLLNNPEKIGDKSFRDQMKNDATGAGMKAGIGQMFGKIGDMLGIDFKNMDFAKMLGPFAPLVESFMGAAKQIFASFKDGNFLGMHNGNSMLADAQNALGSMLGEKSAPEKTQYAQVNTEKGHVVVTPSQEELAAGRPGTPPPTATPPSNDRMASAVPSSPGSGPGGGAAASAPSAVG